jgi:hypothetical protein
MNKKKEILIFIVFLVFIALAGIFLKLPIFTPTSAGEKQSDMVAGLVIQFRDGTTELEAKNILDNCNLPTYKFDYNIVNTPGYYIIVDKNQSCAGAPRCKQRGMFAPPLKIPLKEIITLNNLV